MAIQAVGLALFAWRAMTPASDRRWFVPVMFAAAAPVFTWLYEVWMREVALGGDVDDTDDGDGRRRRRIRQVFGMEALLVLTCLAVAHGTVGLDWKRDPLWGAAMSLPGAFVCMVGCALAVASGLNRRRYRMA